MAPVRSFISLFINLMSFLYLRNSSVKVLKTVNHGLPTFKKKERSASSLGLGRKRYSLFEFMKKVYYFLWARIPTPMSYLVTHKLVAGRYYESASDENKIKVIKGHCHNYNRYVSSKTKPTSASTSLDTIVFIDTPGPFFSSDHVLTGDKVHKTVDIWYPSLCRFFDRLESMYDAKVVVSAHYLSDISKLPDIFGGREVFYGYTNKLVSESKLVVTEQSSATAFAAIYNKPVMFIYSDESKSDSVVMRFSDNMSEILRQPKVNINKIDEIPSILPVVDDMTYQKYRHQWLTSDPEGLTNAQHIEVEVLEQS
ncbi:MAG: hypothetical protein HRS57_03310 [Mycoplasmataceae bacterium]|nr:hypothetical protein [Mycoplasmataceae bacterium]